MSRSIAATNALLPLEDRPAWILTFLALIPLLYLLWKGQLNILTSVVFFLLIVLISVVNRTAAICITFAFLFLLGDIRRIFGELVGTPVLDTLLLVGPAYSSVIALPVLLRLRLTDAISKSVFALMIVMTLEIFNPRQGSIFVGASGALFYLMPLLWFWIGREFGTPKLLTTVIYRVVIPISVLAALLGFYQSFVGFLPWEQAWINSVTPLFHSLYLAAGIIRPFGFFVNSVEYTTTLLIGCACVAGAFLAGRRYYALLFFPLAGALFLSASRTAIVKLLFALAVAWALSAKGGRAWVLRLSLALVFGLGGLFFSLSRLSGSSSAPQGPVNAVTSSAQHQAQGLAHPLDKKYSTAGIHSQIVIAGIIEGFKVPIGNGLGATSLGNSKFGAEAGEATGSSELDFSDVFISMGAIGGLLYFAIVIIICRSVVTYARTADQHTGLVMVAILAALGGAWLALGEYAVTPFIWFLIGALSYSQNHQRRLPSARKAAIPRPGNSIALGSASLSR